MSWQVKVVENRYADSVRLMSISRSVRERDGVRHCELGMGTQANIEFLAQLGANATASPADLIIAVEADDGDARLALAAAEQELASLQSANDGEGGPSTERARPRSLPVAARELLGANVALISVPGDYAALEAHQALSAGMHVFLFSDHVPLEAELELKRRAAELGLLVMGPECGTAMLGGVGLGFANVVRAGNVGIVAAAGTGAQECACLLDAAGVGVSHIVGVGGRDLSSDVGAIMFRQGMQMLAEDDDTDTLLLVSKAPSAHAVARVVEATCRRQASGRRVRGLGRRARRRWRSTPRWRPAPRPPPAWSPRRARARAGAGLESIAPVDGSLLGLYSGGSLAHEAATILEPVLGPLGGNVGHGPRRRDGEPGQHRLLDLGEEEYTQGRPHPMVDLERPARDAREAAADDVGCVLLDVVLGHGGHADPAGGLADGDRPRDASARW